MWTSGYLNCLKFNSQKFPRIPPFLNYRQFAQVRIRRNSQEFKVLTELESSFPRNSQIPSFSNQSLFAQLEIFENSQEFLGIPIKLGIRLARVICIIGNFWEFLGIRNSQKTGNSVRVGGRGWGWYFVPCPASLFSVCNPFSFLPNMRGSQAPAQICHSSIRLSKSPTQEFQKRKKK